jgi:hypothetical protein
MMLIHLHELVETDRGTVRPTEQPDPKVRTTSSRRPARVRRDSGRENIAARP